MHSKTTNATRIRNRRQKKQPKPAEVIAVIVLVGLIFILGFILINGLIASVRPKSANASAAETQMVLNATPTPTPFQPNQDAAQPTLAAGVTATEKVLQKPEGQINILLLGSDKRPNDGGFRTDIILWVSLNPQDGYVSVVSFPRDLFVYIPGWGNNRINVAFQNGGFEMLADTFEVNFGVRPDHYILVDFNGFQAVVNNLGGIDVQTTQNLSDTCATWINPGGYCSVGPGLVHMNGDVALWYARSRSSTNDIDRTRRAQEVIEAIFHRLMSLDAVLKAPDLYNIYSNYVQTDINLADVVSLIPLANTINGNGDIRNYVIGYDHAYDWITSAGAQVLLPDYEAIEALMIEALTLR